MKKDQALAWHERLTELAQGQAARHGFPGLRDDGRLYHDELDGEGRWAQRLSVAGRWPHTPAASGVIAVPGLRYEIWYPVGKGEDSLLLWLGLGPAPALEGLRDRLEGVFKELVEGGKYARRYQPLEPAVSRFHPETIGIQRRIGTQPAKVDAAVLQLLADSLKPIDQAVGQWNADGRALGGFTVASAEVDPLEALRRKFSGS